jgi:hypothetical protein
MTYLPSVTMLIGYLASAPFINRKRGNIWKLPAEFGAILLGCNNIGCNSGTRRHSQQRDKAIGLSKRR